VGSRTTATSQQSMPFARLKENLLTYLRLSRAVPLPRLSVSQSWVRTMSCLTRRQSSIKGEWPGLIGSSTQRFGNRCTRQVQRLRSSELDTSFLGSSYATIRITPSLQGASLSKEPQSSSSRQTTDCRRGAPKRTWFGRPGLWIRSELSRTGSGLYAPTLSVNSASSDPTVLPE